MLYVILIANNRIVTLIRPKTHSIHPAGILFHSTLASTSWSCDLDLHIIMNTIHSPSIFNSPAASSWIPFCLPKFNAGGFVNAYITFIRKDTNVHLSDVTASPSHDDRDATKSLESNRTEENSQPEAQVGLDESGIAFVCISGSGEFDVIRSWCNSVINVIHLPSFWISATYYYYVSETEFRWNIDCTRECLSE